jgi:hypothetical protein
MSTSNPLLYVDVNSQPHIAPSVSSRWIFDISSPQRYIAQQDVVLLSWMEGGPANVLIPYIDLQQLRDVYDPENLGTLGVVLSDYLKTPSFDLNARGAFRIWVARLGQPTAAQLILKDGALANVLQLVWDDPGTSGNKASVVVGAGSVIGKRFTVRWRQEMPLLDNLQNSFHVAYTGNATAATLTITRTADKAVRLQTTLTGASDGSIGLDVDLTQPSFSTVQALVTQLNGQNGYRASMDRFGAALLPSSELDGVAGTTIRTPSALVIRYIGAGTAATMTVSNTALTTIVTGATGQNLGIDFTAAGTNTLGEVVAFINGLSGQYTCQLGPNADPDALALSLLTNVTGQDIRTAAYSLLAQPGKMDYVVTAGLGSIIYALNTRVPRLTASRVPAAVTVPANIAQTFFTGGTNPSPTMGDWFTALDVVDREDLAGGYVFPVTTDPVVQDTVNAWVSAEHTNFGKAFRAWLAPPDSLTPDAAKAMATGFNSTLSCMIPQTMVAASGVEELPPLYQNAMYCGAAAGAIPTQSVTRLVMRGRSLPDRAKFSKAVQEDLLANGVCVLEDVRGVGVRIALAITTSLSADRIDRMLSESIARDVIDQRVRAYVEPLIPHWAMTDFMPTVKGQVLNALESLKADGVITEGRDVNNRIIPAWLPVSISIQAGIMKITLHVFIGGEISHISILGTISYQIFEITIDASV